MIDLSKRIINISGYNKSGKSHWLSFFIKYYINNGYNAVIVDPIDDFVELLSLDLYFKKYEKRWIVIDHSKYRHLLNFKDNIIKSNPILFIDNFDVFFHTMKLNGLQSEYLLKELLYEYSKIFKKIIFTCSKETTLDLNKVYTLNCEKIHKNYVLNVNDKFYTSSKILRDEKIDYLLKD